MSRTGDLCKPLSAGAYTASNNALCKKRGLATWDYVIICGIGKTLSEMAGNLAT